MSSSVKARDNAQVQPIAVYLTDGPKEPLPSGDYVRIVAQHMSQDKKVVRHDFALHYRGARFCRLLDALLDAADVDLRAKVDAVNGLVPPVTLPQATVEGCECIFHYLDLIQTRVPTLLSKPLRAPLEDLVQPWELKFIVEDCFGSVYGGEGGFRSTGAFFRNLCSDGPQRMDRILEIAMLSDFLLIEPLRDLMCAFLASLGLSASSERDLMQLCGLSSPLSEEDLEPLYRQLEFLRPSRSEA